MSRSLMDKTWETDKRKVQKLVEGQNFDMLIMFVICMDAIVLGLLSSRIVGAYLGFELFVLDRLFMAIFIVEMLMKLYAYGPKFFKYGWNVFDLTIVTVSAFSMHSYFIILRAFRLFRVLRYVNRFSRLKMIINTFLLLVPNFLAMLFVFCIFFYIFSIMAVSLYGDTFTRFETLGEASLTLMQVFTLDGWVEDVLRPVMFVHPNAWIFFVAFVFISFLTIISFFMSVFAEISLKKFKPKERI